MMPRLRSFGIGDCSIGAWGSNNRKKLSVQCPSAVALRAADLISDPQYAADLSGVVRRKKTESYF